ncbi:Crp/Fnr family transcriptional regulator [Candidatus Thioglobus sp.]|uniref:Crp/Fnr family transcriptional regulator n=1 Tax=Candidatus Thioglobus sp. TaxID=2026721 RepID=UPI003D14286B
MPHNKQQNLKKDNLFSAFSESELAQISEFSSYQVLAKGQILFAQGQAATDFFLNIDGQIKLAFSSVQGGEKVMNVINKGQSFAEAIMFLDNKRYPLSATALIPSTVLRIDAQCYLGILKKSPEICFKIMGKLSHRLHWMMSEINNLTLHDSTYRLVNFLLNHAHQDNKSATIRLSISKQILASQLAIQPETLSRIFKKLSGAGLLKVDKNYIHLLEVSKLQQLIKS